ncbi:D-alanyl-D-alanine carboxypeptidase [Streptomyces sp. ISL-100]|nr:D-alanyl-D-alanine carboxypeptidase [Streptomyces sp. ISL-100]
MPPPEQSPPASETPESPETPERDARLRAAVAAWVATSDTPADAAATAAEDETDAAEPPADESTPDTPTADAGAAGAAREGGRAAAAAEASRSAATDGDEPLAGKAAATLPADADADADVSGAGRAFAPAKNEVGGESSPDGDATAARQAEADGDAPGAGRAAAAEAAPQAEVDGDASGAGRAAGAMGSGSAAADGEVPSAGGALARADVDASGAGQAAAAAQVVPDAEVDGDASGVGRGAGDTADGEVPSAGGAGASARADVDVSGAGRAAADDDQSLSGDVAGTSDAGVSGTGEVGGESSSGGDVPGARRAAGAGVSGSGTAGGDEPAAGEVAAMPDADVAGRAAAPQGGAGSARVSRDGAESQGDAKASGARREASADSGDSGDDTSGDEPSDGSPTGRGVDQATAVFKAVRPRQAVDQPTTALKAVGKPETKESAAERTSTFVPLKRDDVGPPAARPSRTPDAPPAGPAPSGPAGSPPASAPMPEAERTRQQPLPPRPPLDLLAELTNTPPPPETPVRTAVRRVKIWTPLVLLLVIVFAVAQFLRPLPSPTLALTAKPTYTFEGDALSMPWPEGGQSAVEVQGVGSIGTHGEQKPSPIASVAKAMTAYVILKEHPLKGDETGPKITVDEQAERESKLPDESTAAIREGQQFTERQMLQLLMIPSGNNAARLLARWGAKSQDEFVTKMNDAAKDLGMKNTTYTDPSGLEASTVSTAVDQLKLAKAVMENDVFREIVNMPEAEIPGIEGKIYNNNNILLQPGVSGIKTGSSTPAGGNLLWTANTVIDGKERRIVGAVMGQQDATTPDSKLQLAIARSLKLIQAAQRDVTSATVVKKGEVVGYVDDGLGGQTPVVATKDLKAVGWPGLKVELAISDAGKPLPHAAKKGDEVGQVTVGSGPGQVKAPVALQKDLVEPGFGAKLTRVG